MGISRKLRIIVITITITITITARARATRTVNRKVKGIAAVIQIKKETTETTGIKGTVEIRGIVHRVTAKETLETVRGRELPLIPVLEEIHLDQVVIPEKEISKHRKKG